MERRADRDWARTFGREGAALGADFRIFTLLAAGVATAVLISGTFLERPLQ